VHVLRPTGAAYTALGVEPLRCGVWGELGGPITGPERRLGRPGAAREGLDNTPVLHDRIPPKHFLFMFVEKYPEKFAGKCRQRYPESCARLRRHVCLQLYLYVYLNLNSKLFAELYREKFAKSFQQLFRKFFASLFSKLFDLKYLQL